MDSETIALAEIFVDALLLELDVGLIKFVGKKVSRKKMTAEIFKIVTLHLDKLEQQ